MEESKEVATPMEINLNLKNESDTCFEAPYQNLIGGLMYLSVLTRPDISYPVSYLSQFNTCYSETHWKHVKRILKYLKGTKEYGIRFVKDDNYMRGYVDASWGSNFNDRKSYTGFCFCFSNGPIVWESRKQNTVALSSTEAEYIAISEATREAIFLKNLLYEILSIDECIVLYNDNMGAQKLATNPLLNKRTKHIDIRYHFVTEAVNKNLIELKYLDTTNMPADMLTKSLSPNKHNKFLEELGLVNVV
ncbi:hypothetical protein PV328_008411 [Microctonus aethiopoides]|uniref:Retrovirus-related Pol polyprotein from transposon TNT 1-94 n=1 Tax=Microctonus aethiopoides TaxID=144406 RepID=A0AA39KR09_9HYME|nr:hypothetical protein PV328_008411 [Microctonus aethiopoides]